MPNLDLFQPKNHIWHININLIFFGVCSLSIAKASNEVALINLNDKSDDITNNSPLISSPISLDMLELDNEMFQQTFNSNAYIESNEVKEVITEDLETLYDKIDDNDDKKRENSFKNDITNENDIIFLLPDEPN